MKEKAIVVLVSMGAARLEMEGELSEEDRFALAEGVRFVMGRTTVGWRNFAADQMLYAAIVNVVTTVEEEIMASLGSAGTIFGELPCGIGEVLGEMPCDIRQLVLDAIDRDGEDTDIGLATLDKSEWLHALLGVADDVAGCYWEMEEQFRHLVVDERIELEDALGLSERYFDKVEPTLPQLAGADKFLAGLKGAS